MTRPCDSDVAARSTPPARDPGKPRRGAFDRAPSESKALREALALIVYETTTPTPPGVVGNEWYQETVAVVRGIAERALDGR